MFARYLVEWDNGREWVCLPCFFRSSALAWVRIARRRGFAAAAFCIIGGIRSPIEVPDAD